MSATLEIGASTTLRDFRPDDEAALNALAVAAFETFSEAYDDWSGFRAKIATMSNLAHVGEVIVADRESELVGAVTYLGPHQPRNAFFPVEWAIMRMLVVAPVARGLGLGRALAEECLRRARRDGAGVVGLHTSPIMSIALPMYRRMGFAFERATPPIHGVPYDLYALRLSGR